MALTRSFVHEAVMARDRDATDIVLMQETAKLLTFDEFRAAQPMADVVRQQQSFFRDTTTMDQTVGVALDGLAGWPEWPNSRADE